MFLVDTSIWVDHFKSKDGNNSLIQVLEIGFVYMHPMILGELLLGGFYRNPKIRNALNSLPQLQEPPAFEVRQFIQDQELVGKGVGWVDACLIYSGTKERMQFLTMDQRLAEVYSLALSNH